MISRERTGIARGEVVDDKDIFVLKKKRMEASVSQMVIPRISERKASITQDLITVGEFLPAGTRGTLRKWMNKYRNVIATSMAVLGRAMWTDFDIGELEGSKPVRCKPYRLAGVEKPGGSFREPRKRGISHRARRADLRSKGCARNHQ